MGLEHRPTDSPAPHESPADWTPPDASTPLPLAPGSFASPVRRRPTLPWLNRREERDPLDELSPVGLARCGQYSPLATEPHVDEEFSSELPAVSLDPAAKPCGALARAACAGADGAAAEWPTYPRSPAESFAAVARSALLVAASLAAAATTAYLFVF